MRRGVVSFFILLSLVAPALAGSQADFPRTAKQLLALVTGPAPPVSGDVTDIEPGLSVLPVKDGSTICIQVQQVDAAGMLVLQELTLSGTGYRHYTMKPVLSRRRGYRDVWTLDWQTKGEYPRFVRPTAKQAKMMANYTQRALTKRQAHIYPATHRTGGVLLLARSSDQARAEKIWRKIWGDHQFTVEVVPAKQVWQRTRRQTMMSICLDVMAVGYPNLPQTE